MQDHQNCVPNIFSHQISQIFVDLFSKNTKGWSENSKIWYVEQWDRAEKKTRKQQISQGSPSLCKYFPNIFFSTWSSKIFVAVYLRICWTGPLTLSHPSANLLEFQLILVKILLLLRWLLTRTQISNKSETDFKYFCLKYMNHQKMEAEVCFS